MKLIFLITSLLAIQITQAALVPSPICLPYPDNKKAVFCLKSQHLRKTNALHFLNLIRQTNTLPSNSSIKTFNSNN